MNPYDFVPLDLQAPPLPCKPVWHHTLASNAEHGARLYSGSFVIRITAETPIFIGSTTSSTQDPICPGEHIRDKAGRPIIPGTALKGLLRTVVETLCRGCLTGYDARRKPYEYSVPQAFAPCSDNTSLCVSCRIFGMLAQDKQDNEELPLFLGKVNITDAVADLAQVRYHTPIFTAILEAPKHHHSAFYEHQQRQGELAGRKFYFHQDRLTTDTALHKIPPKPGKKGYYPARQYRNQHIRPVQMGSLFRGQLFFQNLVVDEFAALLLALSLKEVQMRYKLGYGKPIGLGSVLIDIQEMTLIDYATRYTSLASGGSGVLLPWNENEMNALIHEQMASFEDADVCDIWWDYLNLTSLDHLYAIWKWPPASIDYFYPGQRWFKNNPHAPIDATRGLSRHE